MKSTSRTASADAITPPVPGLTKMLTGLNEIQAAAMAATASYTDAQANAIAKQCRELGEALAGPTELGQVAPLAKRGAITPPLPG
jgi:hypothetical protein